MTTHKFTFDTCFERGGHDIEVSVTYGVSEYNPARLYGDYPQPADGGEVEILAIKDAFSGNDVDLTVAEEDYIYDEACTRADSDLAEYYADRDEYMADQARDRRMEA